MQIEERRHIVFEAEQVQLNRARIAEADEDPRDSLSEAQVEAHFEMRRPKAVAQR
jgi:hypothetical protein